MKKYDFSKVRPCHASGGGVTRLYCHAGASGVTRLTRGMSWQTPSERSEACQRGASCHANACGATACFCHATQTDATKRVRSTNIYPSGLFLK